MKGRPTVFALVVGGWMAVALSSVQTTPAVSERLAPQAEPQVEGAPVKALLDKYCVTCHSQRLRTAGLVLEGIDVANPPARADVWERVIAKLRAKSMPPAGMPRPDAATITRSPLRSRPRSIAHGRRTRTPAGSARSIASIASNITMRFAICLRSISM